MTRINSRTAAIFAAFAIFLTNLYVCRELFRTEYINQMGSIESAFIAIARHASGNWTDLTWMPMWYNGIPYQNSYPPLLHLMVAAVSSLTGASAALSYHAVTAFFYCAGAVAVYALSYRLSRSVAGSFVAGAIYSLLSPSAFLIADVRNDLGSVWRPRRLQALLTYGEGPHVTGLALLPIAILLLDVAMKRRKPWWTALTALAFAATVLTNWLAAAALGAAVIAYLVVDHSMVCIRRLAVISVLAYCFAASWIPLSTIRVIQFNAKTIGGDFTQVYKTLPLYGSLIVAGFAVLAYLLLRFKADPVLRFGAVFGYLMAAITLPASWFNIYVLPQPQRYHLEMELGIAMLIPFLLLPLVGRIPVRPALVLAAILALCFLYPARQYRRFARLQMAPVDITKTTEYKAARWMDGNMRGGRVMAGGSVCLWMNAFTDTPQLGGGFDQGTTNFMNRVANYVLYSDDGVTGDRLATSELWLKAFGIDAVQVSGPKGGEHYHPWQHPEKFAGRYQVLWSDGDDYLYKVPRRSASIAFAMAPGDLAARTPTNGIDLDPLRPYVAALDDPANPALDYRWTSRHSMEISGNVPAGRVISVQVSNDPGWHASRGTVRGDGLGLLVVDPQCAGSCNVTLTWDGGLEMKLARLLSLVALAGAILWSVVARLR